MEHPILTTVGDYLELLPQPYKTAALIAATVEEVNNNFCSSFSEAIISFDWNEYAINDADKSWAELYSMALLVETNTDTMWDIPQENIIEAQSVALKDMGFDMNLNLN
tara:strand:- start:403 stop:726 length:324 start_codon:yes stop_codon:yes gene_type:complete